MHQYIIGDVHGEYDALMRLVAKLPKDAKLIFVGDLVDRGSRSADVVKFVRENAHSCVMGNHEEMMISLMAIVLFYQLSRINPLIHIAFGIAMARLLL
ncbi:MAG: metallophosphoesterase [Sulfurovum sp.]|nr:metallophosphoesterase [Sulfurovum sp.]